MTSNDEQRDAPAAPRPHPDFDGHLEVSLEKMTLGQKLDWIDQMMRFAHWAKHDLRRDSSDELPDNAKHADRDGE